jgi:hypothetical protein
MSSVAQGMAWQERYGGMEELGKARLAGGVGYGPR